jgi:cysteinyl-tRNA synthetase
MSLVITNTLTGRKEPFRPMEAGRVRMYVCGLTPYDHIHAGHARTYVAFDVVRRWLEFRGFTVDHVQNITDVEDKIMARAREVGEPPLELASRFWGLAEQELARLNVLPAHHHPRVSEHIPGIVRMTQALIDRGHAYVGRDAEGPSVYYAVGSFPRYGELSHMKREDMLEGVRKDPTEGKRDPADFALWKAAKPGELAWDSPWGRGRPGWHIECSVMAAELLGPSIDIHGGGRDLMFPHHENERAQSEAATGARPFVRYWMHTGFLTVSGEKMSKSLGNFVTLSDVLSRWRPEAIRLWLIGTHYRSPIDYSEIALEQASRNLEKIENMMGNLAFALEKTKVAAWDPARKQADRQLLEALTEGRRRFEEAMDDDFNTPVALAALLEAASAINRGLNEGVSHETTLRAREVFLELANLFAIVPPEPSEPTGGTEAELLALILEIREAARKRKVFEIADLVRDRLAELGYLIEDTADGPRWKRERR